MQSANSGTTTLATRAWEPPAITKLAIGKETKSTARKGRAVSSEPSRAEQLAQPQPPSVPAAKLGFAFEWAFPLSARFSG